MTCHMAVMSQLKIGRCLSINKDKVRFKELIFNFHLSREETLGLCLEPLLIYNNKIMTSAWKNAYLSVLLYIFTIYILKDSGNEWKSFASVSLKIITGPVKCPLKSTLTMLLKYIVFEDLPILYNRIFRKINL